MNKPRTVQTEASVDEFINSVKDELKQKDCRTIARLFASATGEKPKMWGGNIIGCGKHHYQYANGKPGEICKVGFSPRARSFSFYLPKFPEQASLIEMLGKHKYSGGCLHITRVADVDVGVLSQMITKAYEVDGGCDA